MIRRIAFTAAVSLALSGTLAHAVTLSTHAVEGGDRTGCTVTNVGTKPVGVSVELFDFTGDKIVAENDGCAVASPLAPHQSCAVAAPEGEPVSCVFKASSGTVRASLDLFDVSNHLIESVPAK